MPSISGCQRTCRLIHTATVHHSAPSGEGPQKAPLHSEAFLISPHHADCHRVPQRIHIVPEVPNERPIGRFGADEAGLLR